VAATGKGIAELYSTIETLYGEAQVSGRFDLNKRKRLAFEVQTVLKHKIELLWKAQQDQILDSIVQGQMTPETAVRLLLGQLKQ
jgi:putative protein kinase ArgK-like GTPase of G3E family